MLKSFLKSIYWFLYPSNSIKSSYFIGLIGLIGLTISIYIIVIKDLPSPDQLTSKPVPLTTHIRDRHGVELYKIYRDQNRTYIPLNEIPENIITATISIEDKDFYQHSGFSLSGIIRAAYRTLTKERIEGGSTITQQLVKTSLLSPERTFKRKIRELVLSIIVDAKYSKHQILELYLNRVSYGGAAYGIEEAAQLYFGKSVRQLDLAESALLAGLPAAPTTYSPFGSRPELAKTRQKEVLRRMAEDGKITWDQATQASSQDLTFAKPVTNIKAAHFVMYVKDWLAARYGTDVVEQGGLDVTTTLDLELQEKTEKIVSEEIAKVAYLKIGNGAALITDPRTGEILSMVGSKNYFDIASDGNVNVTLMQRQPGSSIKPLNYALALQNGYSPSSLIDDSPITYKVAGQADYSPVNYDGRFHGKVPLRTALGSSYNIPAVKLLAANGVQNFINLATKMGISTWTQTNRFGLSLTLGGGEVTMLDMTKAYGVFANNGSRLDPLPIISVRDATGKLLIKNSCVPSGKVESYDRVIEIIPCSKEKVLDSKVTYLISDILADNAARAPAFGYRSDLFVPGHQVAVKTGTTNNLKDNWTIGYYPERLVAVWVGNNNGSPMSYVASGVTGASPIWRRIMAELIKLTPPSNFTIPTGLVRANICIITGELACQGCPTKSELFVEGTQPTRACNPDYIKTYLEDKAKKDQEERDKLLQGTSTSR